MRNESQSAPSVTRPASYACTNLALAACGVLPASAERSGIGLYMDQDMFVPTKSTDRDYTMGIGVEFFADEGPLYQLDGLVRSFGRLFNFPENRTKIYRSYLLGSVTYTPEDLTRTDPIFDDRPYASIVYLANKRIAAEGDQAVGAEFLVGLLGTNIAHTVQAQIHQWWRDATGEIEPVDPQGWNNQISDGGELTARFRFVNSTLLDVLPRSRYWDLASTWDVSLGYQTNASVGLSARAGWLGSPFWSIPFDPINRGNFLPAARGNELYLWAAARGRAIGYDALLQGQFRDSVFTLGGSDKERLVWEGALGVTGSWEGLQLTLALNGKSAETKLTGAQDEHYWGGLYLNYRF